MSNYAFWAINIKYVLMNKDVWEVVNSTFVKLSSLFNSEPSSETFFKLLIAFSHLFWSKNNSKTCVTIALRCINSFKRFIKNLNTHIMWLKLKKLYKVQRFNVCYLMFTTLLSHHYNNCKSVKNYGLWYWAYGSNQRVEVWKLLHRGAPRLALHCEKANLKNMKVGNMSSGWLRILPLLQ